MGLITQITITTTPSQRLSTHHTLHMKPTQQKVTTLCIRQTPHFCPKCHHVSSEKDAELKIIKGSHNHNSGDEIDNIYPKHNGKPINIGHHTLHTKPT